MLRVNEQYRWLCAACAVVGNACAHITIMFPHARPLHVRVSVPGNIPILNPFAFYRIEPTHVHVDHDRIGDYEYSVLARGLQLAGVKGTFFALNSHPIL